MPRNTDDADADADADDDDGDDNGDAECRELGLYPVSADTVYAPPHFRRLFPAFSPLGPRGAQGHPQELLPTPAGAAAEAAAERAERARAETPDTPVMGHRPPPPSSAKEWFQPASSATLTSSSSSSSSSSIETGGGGVFSSTNTTTGRMNFDGLPDLTDPAAINAFMATLPSM